MTRNQLDEEPVFSKIRERIDRIFAQIEESALGCGRKLSDVTVMAVTKTVAPELVNYAAAYGKLPLLGENRAQELCAKYEDYTLKKDNIHFIGHLQTNKVRQIFDKVSMIQSVDSLKLAEEINRLAKKNDTVMDILLEVNIGCEESKSGIFPQQTAEMLEQLIEMSQLNVRGLMAIPPMDKTELYFGRMQELYQRLGEKYPFDTLSLGMSGDYPLAVRYGSTMVRLGSAIFGPRNYPAGGFV